MRRFAEDTTVPVARSRGQIDELLRAWHAAGIQWTDEFDDGIATLRFRWPHDGVSYMARFRLQLPSLEQLREHATNQRGGRGGAAGTVSESKLDKLVEGRGRQEHRLLLLWLKAALHAVAAGLVDAETIFLPWLEGADGQTVAEVALPRLPQLLKGSAHRLLTQ